MKVYYKIPDSGEETQNKMMGLLYDNFRLRILLALQPVEKLIKKEKGMIIIEPEGKTGKLQIRYEGFSKDLELIIRFCIAQHFAKRKS